MTSSRLKNDDNFDCGSFFYRHALSTPSNDAFFSFILSIRFIHMRRFAAWIKHKWNSLIIDTHGKWLVIMRTQSHPGHVIIFIHPCLASQMNACRLSMSMMIIIFAFPNQRSWMSLKSNVLHRSKRTTARRMQKKQPQTKWWTQQLSAWQILRWCGVVRNAQHSHKTISTLFVCLLNEWKRGVQKKYVDCMVFRARTTETSSKSNPSKQDGIFSLSTG